MEIQQFSALKSKPLTKCYEALALIKLSDLEDEEMPEVRKVMETVVIKTQSFLRIMTPDDSLFAKKMKQNFEIFKDELEQCTTVAPFLKKLQILWERFSMLEQRGKGTTESEKKKQEIPDPFTLLKSCRLSKCFEILVELKLSSLTSEQIIELEGIIKNVILRTHSFMGIMTRNDFQKAKEMKKQFDAFIKNAQTCKSLNVPFDEFENAWKTLEMFDPNSAALEKRRQEKKMVDKVIDEFEKSPKELFLNLETEDFDPVKEIEEVLALSNMNEYLLPFVPSFICRAISVINQNSDDGSRIWKKKVYIINDNSYPYVVFNTNDDEYFVDSYGNVYLNEMHFLQTFKKDFGTFSFESSDGKCYDVELLEDKRYLEMFSEVLKRVNHSKAYLQLLKKYDKKEEDVLKILKLLKFHFNFFYDMDEWLMESHSNSFDIFLKNNRYSKETLVIKANNRDYPNTSDWLMKNYYHFFNSIDVSYNHKTAYPETVEHILTYFNTAPTEFFFEVYNRYIRKLQKKFNDNLINIFHFIAADVITFLLSKRLIKYALRPVHLKYIIRWVADKYGGLDELSLMNHYNKYKKSIKKEYKNLIKATKNAEKSVVYRFSNIFVAAYHFSKHYSYIRATLEKNANNDVFKTEITEMPPTMNFKNKEDLVSCASFYFKTLPDILIAEENCVPLKNEPNEHHAVKSWKIYRKYSIEVVECILAEKYCKQMGYSTFIGSIFVAQQTKEVQEDDSDSLVADFENDFNSKCFSDYYKSLTVKSSRMTAY